MVGLPKEIFHRKIKIPPESSAQRARWAGFQKGFGVEVKVWTECILLRIECGRNQGPASSGLELWFSGILPPLPSSTYWLYHPQGTAWWHWLTTPVPHPRKASGREFISSSSLQGETASLFPGVPRCSFCSNWLWSGGPSELGWPHIQTCLEESPSTCHRINNSTFFLFWKALLYILVRFVWHSLYDTEYGHPCLNSHWAEWSHLMYVHSSPGIWEGKESQNKIRTVTRKQHGSWTAKPTDAHFSRCDEVDSLSWKRNIYNQAKLRELVRHQEKRQKRGPYEKWLALSKLWLVASIYLSCVSWQPLAQCLEVLKCFN